MARASNPQSLMKTSQLPAIRCSSVERSRVADALRSLSAERGRVVKYGPWALDLIMGEVERIRRRAG